MLSASLTGELSFWEQAVVARNNANDRCIRMIIKNGQLSWTEMNTRSDV